MASGRHRRGGSHDPGDTLAILRGRRHMVRIGGHPAGTSASIGAPRFRASSRFEHQNPAPSRRQAVSIAIHGRLARSLVVAG